MSAPPHVTPIFARRWACFFGVLYPFGVPAALWYLLHTRRNQQDEFERGWHARLRLVTKSYSEELWWFEVYELLRKCLLCGVLIFIMPETATQVAMGLLISVASATFHVHLKPFKEAGDNDDQTIVLSVISFSLFSGLLLKTDTANEDQYEMAVFTAVLTAVNVVAIAVPPVHLVAGLVSRHRKQPQQIAPDDAEIDAEPSVDEDERVESCDEADTPDRVAEETPLERIDGIAPSSTP